MSDARPEEAVGVERLEALRAAHGKGAAAVMVEEILYRLQERGHLPSAANMLFVVGSVPAPEWEAAIARGVASGWQIVWAEQ